MTRLRRAADQNAFAIKQNNLDRDVATLDDPRRRLLRGARDGIAERDVFLACPKASAALLATAIRSHNAAEPPTARANSASRARSTSPRLECRSVRPCASLVILPTPPAMVTRGRGCARRY